MNTVSTVRAAFVAALLVVAGCAQNPMHRDAGRVDLKCPPSHNMVCEANKIGRIRHGTFAHETDKCACVPDTGRTLESPVIPTIRQ